MSHWIATYHMHVCHKHTNADFRITHDLVAEPVLVGTWFWVAVVHRHSLSQNRQHSLREKEKEGGEGQRMIIDDNWATHDRERPHLTRDEKE